MDKGGWTHFIRIRSGRHSYTTHSARPLEPRDIPRREPVAPHILKGRSQRRISRAFCTHHSTFVSVSSIPTGRTRRSHHSSEPAPTVSACAARYAAKSGPTWGVFSDSFPRRVAHWCRSVLAKTRTENTGKDQERRRRAQRKAALDAFGSSFINQRQVSGQARGKPAPHSCTPD
jgi:hypothetical protein